jgi:hypothetical protein
MRNDLLEQSLGLGNAFIHLICRLSALASAICRRRRESVDFKRLALSSL